MGSSVETPTFTHLYRVRARTYTQNNVLVHYSCLQDKHVCPVTGVNFLDQYNASIANGGDGITYT